MALRLRRARPAWMGSALCALILLSGCAALPDSGGERAIDEAKVQTIERAARANGVLVRWVNYPVKPPQ